MSDDFYSVGKIYGLTKPAYGKSYFKTFVRLDDYQHESLFPSDPVNQAPYNQFVPATMERDFFTPGAGNSVLFTMSFRITPVGTLTKLTLKPFFIVSPDNITYDINSRLATYIEGYTQQEKNQEQYRDFLKDIGIVPLTIPYIDMGDPNNPYMKVIEPEISLYPDYSGAAFSVISFEFVALADSMFFQLLYEPNTPGGTLISDTSARCSMNIAAWSGPAASIHRPAPSTIRTDYP